VSYSTIWTCAADLALQGRITACIAQEVEPGVNPHERYIHVLWPVITASDVEAAYASALAAGNLDPGGDEAVITDGMLLSHVQATLAALPPPEAV
jgi:hypothetical protein